MSQNGYIVFSHPSVAVKHLGNPKTWKQFFLKEKWRGEGVLENCIRKFPKIEFDKALVFAFISLFCAAGILTGGIWSIAVGQSQLFMVSLSGMLAIPILMTLKILMKQPQWHKFFVLLPLLTVYGLARGWSVSSRKVWETLQHSF